MSGGSGGVVTKREKAKREDARRRNVYALYERYWAARASERAATAKRQEIQERLIKELCPPPPHRGLVQALR